MLFLFIVSSVQSTKFSILFGLNYLFVHLQSDSVEWMVAGVFFIWNSGHFLHLGFFSRSLVSIQSASRSLKTKCCPIAKRIKYFTKQSFGMSLGSFRMAKRESMKVVDMVGCKDCIYLNISEQNDDSNDSFLEAGTGSLE